MTPNPDAAWMAQIARNVSMTGDGFLQPGQCIPYPIFSHGRERIRRGIALLVM